MYMHVLYGDAEPP